MIGETTTTINPEYPTKNLDSFMAEMMQPKQNMDLNERPPEDEAFNNVTAEPIEPPKLQMGTGPAKATAKMITAVIDNTIPAALGIIAKEDSNAFKATSDEREELVDALTEYVKLKGGDIPPGLMVTIIILTVYGSKLPFAIQQRKLNNIREQLEKQEEELHKRESEIAAREAAQKQKEQEALQQINTTTQQQTDNV